jgi:capsid protein
MSKFAERIYDRWFAPKKVAKRRFAAAKISRQNADWTATPYGANWTIYRDNRIMRARAREMAQNSPLIRKFLKMAERNVVGHKGIQLQCNAVLGTAKKQRPNTKLNTMVETAFWEWSFKENCTVSGKLCFVEAQKLLLRYMLRDGEALVQHISNADNPFGYALKFWNVDWLDETYNEELSRRPPDHYVGRGRQQL